MNMVKAEQSGAALNDRAQRLLKALVESYIGDGQPVGSRTLARTAGLELSPATIRNVMADLEDMGFIESPHTSAGRIPTVQGYRLFVDTLLKVQPLNPGLVDALKIGLTRDDNPLSLVEAATQILSGVTSLAGIVTVPKRSSVSLRRIEFLPLADKRALAIMVMNEQEVQNRVIQLDREYSASELQEVANYLNTQFAGKNIRDVRAALLSELDEARKGMNRIMLSAVELGEKAFMAEESGDDDFMVSGQTRLMDYDELADVASLRQLFEAFNQKREILHLLDKCISAEGVQIFIGSESGHQILDHCSVVTAPYSVDDDVVGVLGVIGPTRIAYDRVIPLVDITARLLGAALNPRN